VGMDLGMVSGFSTLHDTAQPDLMKDVMQAWNHEASGLSIYSNVIAVKS
jgi:hypothetical protein